MKFEQALQNKNVTPENAKYLTMFEKQANERNAYRVWYKKLLGMDKKDYYDTMREQADRYNEAIDRELASGNSKSMTEAMDKTDVRDEFQLKSGDKVMQEEFAKQRLLVLADSLDKNNFAKVGEQGVEIIQKIGKSAFISAEIKKTSKEYFLNLIMGKSQDLLLDGEYESFVSLVDNLSYIKKFSKDDFKNVSPEIMKSGMLIKAVESVAVKSASGPDSFINTREIFSKIGVMSVEEMNRIPGVIQGAKTDITRNPTDVAYFVKWRDRWVEAGVVTKEEANKYPEIIKGAKEDITGKPTDVAYFILWRDRWVQAGVTTVEEANNFTEIKQGAKADITGKPTDVAYFVTWRDRWIKAGVVTKEEANKYPETIKGAKADIAGKPTDVSYFVTWRDRWIKAGVVSIEEANNFPEIKAGAKADITGKPTDVAYFVTWRDKWVKAGVVTKEEANNFPIIKQSVKSEILKYPNDKKLWVNAGVITAEEADKLNNTKK